MKRVERATTRSTLFSCAAALSLMSSPSAVTQTTSPRPELISQAYDDDCGLAALQMLFRSTGIEITRDRLMANLAGSARQGALSASDLIDMTAGSGTRRNLLGGFASLSRLRSLAKTESFIILMRPRSFGGADGFDHSVVIQRALTAGFLASDPLIAARTMLSEDLVRRDAHQKRVSGEPYVFVLRLVDGRGVAPSAF